MSLYHWKKCKSIELSDGKQLHACNYLQEITSLCEVHVLVIKLTEAENWQTQCDLHAVKQKQNSETKQKKIANIDSVISWP